MKRHAQRKQFHANVDRRIGASKYWLVEWICMKYKFLKWSMVIESEQHFSLHSFVPDLLPLLFALKD